MASQPISLFPLLVAVLFLATCCFGDVYRLDSSMKKNQVISSKLPFTTRSHNLRTVLLSTRGGSTLVDDDEDEDEDENEASVNDIRNNPEFETLQAYRMKQQILMQLRATYLSEALAKRGLPITTIADVSTPEGAAPPEKVDWDCALATEEEPKSCLYSFDAQFNTKVLAPLGTTQWISVAALNRLRRTDPSKVETMWHSKYAILKSWFDAESEYSLLQHVGIQGFLLNSLLQGIRLRVVLGLSIVIIALICMPILEYLVNRLLVSGVLWTRWHQWSRFVHAALPLKLLLGQMTGRFVAKMFDKLLKLVKDRLVELECQILEQHIPLTVGVPTISSSDEDDDGVDGWDEILDSEAGDSIDDSSDDDE